MTKLTNSVLFRPFALFMAMVMLVSMTATAAPDGQVVLKGGTNVPLELINKINSKTASAGTLIDFRVLADVIVDGKTVIPVGSIAKGQIVKVKKSGLFGQEGELVVKVNSVTAVDGTTVFLSASDLSNEGDSQMVISIVLTFLCLFGFLIKGGSAEIPAGFQVIAHVGNNTSISVD